MYGRGSGALFLKEFCVYKSILYETKLSVHKEKLIKEGSRKSTSEKPQYRKTKHTILRDTTCSMINIFWMKVPIPSITGGSIDGRNLSSAIKGAIFGELNFCIL